MTDSYVSRFKDRWNDVVAWLVGSADGEIPAVDVEYVATEFEDRKWVSVTQGGEYTRCNVCGKLFVIENTPELIEHVASHSHDSPAEIDPTSSEITELIENADISAWSVEQ